MPQYGVSSAVPQVVDDESEGAESEALSEVSEMLGLTDMN